MLRHLVVVSSMIALAASALATAEQALGVSPRYLFTWVGDDDRLDSDFLAVVDLDRQGDRYGTIVATTPVGEKGLWPHHTEHELGASGMLFANGFSANRNLLFDLTNPRVPKVVERFDGAGDLSFLHSWARHLIDPSRPTRQHIHAVVRTPNGTAMCQREWQSR